MEAMPPLDYDQLATKTDVANPGIELRGEITELRGDMTRIEGSQRGEMANMLKTMMITQLVTALALSGFVGGRARDPLTRDAACALPRTVRTGSRPNELEGQNSFGSESSIGSKM